MIEATITLNLTLKPGTSVDSVLEEIEAFEGVNSAETGEPIVLPVSIEVAVTDASDIDELVTFLEDMKGVEAVESTPVPAA